MGEGVSECKDDLIESLKTLLTLQHMNRLLSATEWSACCYKETWHGGGQMFVSWRPAWSK